MAVFLFICLEQTYLIFFTRTAETFPIMFDSEYSFAEVTEVCSNDWLWPKARGNNQELVKVRWCHIKPLAEMWKDLSAQ